MTEPTLLGRAELAEAARGAAAAAGPAVVRVGRQGGRGCGIVVADDRVLTNAHNLRDRTTEITFADGRAVQGELTATDAAGDVCVLAVDVGGIPPLPWAEAGAQPGDVVFALARTAGGGARVSFGMLSGVDRAFRGPRGRRVSGSLEHTAPLARGSSGSALLDGTGALVGLNTARLGDGFYLALPADAELRSRVEALARGESPRTLVLGVGLARPEVAARLRASVGLPDRAGLLVRSVDPAGPAAVAGIAVGDLLVSAGARSLETVDDLHDALAALGEAQALEITAIRGTDEVSFTVSFPG